MLQGVENVDPSNPGGLLRLWRRLGIQQFGFLVGEWVVWAVVRIRNRG